MSSIDIYEKVLNEAALSDTFVYKSFNKNAELTTILTAAVKDSTIIDENYIDEQLLTIRRIHLSPIQENVISAFLTGEIVLLISNIKKVPSFVPFFTTRQGTKVRTYVFLNNFAKIIKVKDDLNNDHLDIPAKNLYALMEGAYISYQYSLFPNKFIRSIGLMRPCLDTYVAMVMRILNKEYALSMDVEAYDKVAYAVGRFFAESVWGITNGEQIFSYASHTKSVRDQRSPVLGMVHDEYELKSITSVDELIDFLKTLTPRLASLSARYYYQRWIETYKYSAAFAMESAPYFMYCMTCTTIGSFLINSPLINDISKDSKGMRTYYTELAKVL